MSGQNELFRCASFRREFSWHAVADVVCLASNPVAWRSIDLRVTV